MPSRRISGKWRAALGFLWASTAFASTELSLGYGQTADLWSTYHGIQDAKSNVAQIDSILSSRYGTFEEGIAQVSVLRRGLSFADKRGPWRTFYFGLNAYGLVSGSVDNPIIPVLHVDLNVGGAVAFGTEGELPFGSVGTRFGIVGGWGSEKRADAYSTDLIDHIAFVSGNLGFVGLEQKFAEPSPTASDPGTYRAALEMHETFFHSTIPVSSAVLSDETQELLAFRWKQTNEWSTPVAALGTSRLGLQVIFGQQPIPVEILPRVWDWSHQLAAFPEIGTLVGGGAHWRAWGNSHSLLDAYAGVYAGYFGIGCEWRYRALSVSLGSWGLEGRSAYLSQTGRVWIARLGLTF